jgi:hypothetical protein
MHASFVHADVESSIIGTLRIFAYQEKRPSDDDNAVVLVVYEMYMHFWRKNRTYEQ